MISSSLYRACGRIFCNDCSKNRMALAHLGYYVPERVCDECFRKLNATQSSIDDEVQSYS